VGTGSQKFFCLLQKFSKGCTKENYCSIGENSPNGRVFTMTSYLKITEIGNIFGPLCSKVTFMHWLCWPTFCASFHKLIWSPWIEDDTSHVKHVTIERQKKDLCAWPQPNPFPNHTFSFTTLLAVEMAVSHPEQLHIFCCRSSTPCLCPTRSLPAQFM
jgi:hypothetical protein